MSNLISDRVSFFLKDVPPFSELNEDELDQVAQNITVKYLEEDEFLFKEGEEQGTFCYVLNQGNVKLLKAKGTANFLVDQCEPGDVFGVRSLITGNPYSMTAQCVEESLVYAIPAKLFHEFYEANASFSSFFASGYAAGQIIVRGDRESIENPIQTTTEGSLSYPKDVITCLENQSITEAAQIMSEHHVGSIIVINNSGHPKGIITDTDLRNKVLASDEDAASPVKKIMSTPVKTVMQGSSLTEALMEMIKSSVHHLVVTKDGSNKTELCGIISDHDIMLSQQNHPASLIKSVKQSDDPLVWKESRNRAEELLKDFLDQGLNMSLVSSLITKVNDTIIKKAIEKALKENAIPADISFAWLNLGSEGREEQLLRTDQDNAILFADTKNNSKVQEALLKIAESVNQTLVDCGFEECPANIMARNPKYCQPLPEWKEYFLRWIKAPDPKSLMNATIFFDFKVGYGNEKLASQLSEFLKETIKENELFLNFLAQNSLQNPPPLSFFKNFLVERSGEHKDELDIKKRGMMPLSDAARLLILDHHITDIQNTSDRFRKLSELEPRNKDLFDSAAEAYELFMRHRAINGLRDNDSGRFISLDNLSKLDKQILKNAFLSVKEIQDIIKVRFQQSYFN